MDNNQQKLERLKFNAYLVMIIATIIFIFVYINLDSEDISYAEANKLSQNITTQKPINFNHTYQGYLYYAPKHYLETEPSDYTINLLGNNSKFTLHFSDPNRTTEMDLSQVNSEYKLIYPKPNKKTNTQAQCINNETYFCVWEISDELIQVIIGEGDQYIAGEFPAENKKEYITEMSYIYNSIKPTNEIKEQDEN